MPATNNPPDKWTISGGVWGTDWDRESSVVNMGKYSLKKINTGTASSLLGPIVPLQPACHYRAGVMFRATNNSNNVLVDCVELDSADGTISTKVVRSTPAAAADTWYYVETRFKAAGTVRKARMSLDAASGVNVYFNLAEIARCAASFSVQRTNTSVTMTASAYTDITYNSTDHNYGLDLDTTTGIWTCPHDGVYRFSGAWGISTLDNGKRMICALKVNGTLAYEGPATYNSTGGNLNALMAAVTPVTLKLAAGDTVKMCGYHDNGTNRTTVNNSTQTWFEMTEIL